MIWVHRVEVQILHSLPFRYIKESKYCLIKMELGRIRGLTEKLEKAWGLARKTRATQTSQIKIKRNK